jgi:hypothetical protein
MSVASDRQKKGAKARKERKKDRKGQARRDKPKNIWRAPARKQWIGGYVWRITAWRPERPWQQRRLGLDSVVESFTWADDGPVQTGTIAIRAPYFKKLNIDNGHIIRVDVGREDRKGWRLLWEMRVTGQDRSTDGSRTYELADDLDRLRRSQEDFKYHKGKGHQKGWLPHEIARDVAKQYDLGIKTLAEVKGVYIRKMTKTDASPLAVINAAYKRAKEETGDSYVVSLRKGKLAVTRLRASRYLWLLGPMLQQASLSLAMREDFATELLVRGAGGTGKGKGKKKKQKIKSTVDSKRLKAKYGTVRRTLRLKDVESQAEARDRGRRKLASWAEPERELTFSHPGIPVISRGDAVYMPMKETLGLKRIVFVKSVSWSVSPGTFSMDITCRFNDPTEDKQKTKKDEKKKDKAQKNGRKGKERKKDGARDKRKTRNRNKSRKKRQRSDRHNVESSVAR